MRINNRSLTWTTVFFYGDNILFFATFHLKIVFPDETICIRERFIKKKREILSRITQLHTYLFILAIRMKRIALNEVSHPKKSGKYGACFSLPISSIHSNTFHFCRACSFTYCTLYPRITLNIEEFVSFYPSDT